MRCIALPLAAAVALAAGAARADAPPPPSAAASTPLAAAPAPERLDVEAAERAGRRDRQFAGAYVTLGAGGVVAWSMAFLAFGASSHDPRTQRSLYTVSGVMGGVGLGLGVVGVTLLLTSRDKPRAGGVVAAKAPTRWALTPQGVVF